MGRLPLVPIPEGARCFVCGRDNKHGLHLQFWLLEEHVEAEWVASEVLEGWPGIVHGTAFAALHDDAAAWAMIALAGQTGFTTRMTISFARPIALGQRVTVKGRVERVEGRTGTFATEILLPDGSAASTALTEFALVDLPTLERMLRKPLSEPLRSWMVASPEQRRALVRERARARLAGKA